MTALSCHVRKECEWCHRIMSPPSIKLHWHALLLFPSMANSQMRTLFGYLESLPHDNWEVGDELRRIIEGWGS